MQSRVPFLLLLKTFLGHTRYVPVLSRGLWRKHLGAKRDIKKTKGIATVPPLQISLRITNHCNQRCAICGQFGQKGYMHAPEGKRFWQEIPVTQYFKLVDELAFYKPVYYITGGEALLYKDLFELTDYIKKGRGFVYVITNGSLLSQHVDKILEQKWDMLASSFDGPESIHDQCRGLDGTFQKTIQGIGALLTERKRRKQKSPFFVLCATVSATNQNHLQEMFDIASQTKPDCLILYLSWFTNQNLGEEHARILKEELGVDAVTWKSYIGQNEKIDTQALRSNLEKIAKKKFSFPWFTIPSIPLDQLDIYYHVPADFLGYGPCLFEQRKEIASLSTP